MRKSAIGLASLILGAAACSSPAPKSESTGSTSAALLSPKIALSSPKVAPLDGPTLDLNPDQGPSDPSEVVSVSVIFKSTATDQLEQYVQATQEPSSGLYHHFLSVHDFAALFAPSSHDIARVAAYLQTFGITVGATLADNLVLNATGTIGAFTQAFTFDIHDFKGDSGKFHRPVTSPKIPRALEDVLLVVAGFSTQPAFRPQNIRARSLAPGFQKPVVLPANGTASGDPGNYTVGDFANQYDVNPLYSAGINGAGSTIGIATLASFYPADAYAYWSAINLPVKQNRITQVHVDGGGQVGAEAGSSETSLDVEQSGGIAPQASIVVYDAPNTDGGFLDLFYNAASDNVVDSLSVSWGGPEVFYNAALAGTDLTAELGAFHQAFLEAAAQGISLFASAGDSGAYDASGLPGVSNFLTVDVPGSDPAITSAGGTTTPITLTAASFGLDSTLPNVVISQEQVWGWDYLSPYFGESNVFSVGGGGGVSSFWAAPWYQQGLDGIRTTEANQVVTVTSVTDDGGTSTQTLLTLPADFRGRNVPDVSADADPFSGYIVYSSSDSPTPINGIGGTSFVAPQLNGVAALLRQRLQGRVGLLNPSLYRLAQRGHRGPVTDITAGDNWFYDGIRGYEPAAGVGVLDVAQFARDLAAESSYQSL